MKKLMKKVKMNNKGFTLVELIVVIAVLAIITVVAAPQYIKYVEKSRIGTDENAIGEIAHIAEISYVELKANNDDPTATIDNEITVTVGTDKCFTVGGTANGTDLDAAVEQMMGKYEPKSKTYTAANASVKITINDSGVAQWNKLTPQY